VVYSVGLANVLVDVSADEESARRNVIKMSVATASVTISDQLRSYTIKDTDLVDTAKVEGFIENTVLNYSLDDFPSHFRMSRSTSGPLHTFWLTQMSQI